MSQFSRLIWVAVYIFIFTPIIITIFSFFGVPIETYLNYILWMIALGIFFTIIPMGRKNLFA